MWVIKKNNKIIKKYPFKIQCTIWLYIHGWVFSGYGDFYDFNKYYFIICPYDESAIVTIEEIENE